ncbi:MAG TPA: FAD-binding protein, partial [Rubrivivax sp.]
MTLSVTGPVVEQRVSLRTLNSFGLPAMAANLARVRSDADVRRIVDHPQWGTARKFVLGGGSNVVFTHDVADLVLKVEVPGMRLLQETHDAWIVEAGAGESWHGLVEWTLAQGYPGLE